MTNFSGFESWGFISLLSVLLLSLLLANLLKKSIRFLKLSLIPTSVLGGAILLLLSLLWQSVTGNPFFDGAFFGGDGTAMLERITYHCLALGFIATSLRSRESTHKKERRRDILNTGITTVSTYLLQGVLGLGITYLISLFSAKMFPAAGVLLPFGYGQGTGQAMNYGSIYEAEYGFFGGKSFGLTIAALGFLSASIGGVIHLYILRRRGLLKNSEEEVTAALNSEQIQSKDEIPMNGSIDKMTVQIAIIVSAYFAAYLLMFGLAKLLPSLSSVLYGFNFLFGVLMAMLIRSLLKVLRKKDIVNKEYLNPFLLTRASGFFFDLMVVAGIAAIRLEVVAEYSYVLLLLGVVGAVSTYYYNRFIAKKLFPAYAEAQFLVMYGMLTGTASTGVMLLREFDVHEETPAADNLVYQNLPAMVLGFPLMLLATLAPTEPVLTWVIMLAFFATLNLLLFRRQIFKKKHK